MKSKAGSRLCDMPKVAEHLCLPLQKQIHLETHTGMCIHKSSSHIGKEGLQHIIPPSSFLSSPWINIPSVQMKKLSTKMLRHFQWQILAFALFSETCQWQIPALLCRIKALTKYTSNYYQLSKSTHTF